MPTLNNVYWRKGEISEPITVDEAIKFESKIRAKYGILFCGLCLEPVSFCWGDKNVPYFKHSKSEGDKECKERALIRDRNEKNIPNEIKTHNNNCFLKQLPLKLNNDHFEIGFPYIEIDNYSELFYIIPQGWDKIPRSFERLSRNRINYYSAGNRVVPIYEIYINNTKINKFIPKYIEGIYRDYTFFDFDTGKKIPYNGYIRVNQDYYLLSKKRIENYWKNNSIVLNYKMLIDNYCLYEFKVIEYNNEIKTFVYNVYSYNLIDEDSIFNKELVPLWPTYVKRPYFIDISKDNDKLYFNKNKEIQYKLYPKESASSIQDNFLSLWNNYNLLSFGLFKDYEFLTIMKKKFDENINIIDSLYVKVVDFSKYKKDIQQGLCYQLPFKRRLCLKNPKFDGFLEIVSNNGFVKNNIEFKSGEVKNIYDLQFGDTVNIYYGLDLVWSVKYENKKDDKIDDEKVYLELQKLTGKKINISHSLASIAVKMDLYPKTKNWFLKQIRNGFIIDKAFYKLKEIF